MATYQISKAYASQKVTGIFKVPSITGVTRLETQPTAVNLKAGLQAQLADPLWMLSRQWQFNEFQGEDAGTPLRVAFSISGTEVDAFRSGKDSAAPWQTLSDGDAPIETRVEAEAAWSVHPRLRGEAGLHAMRMASPVVRAALLAAYPITFAPVADPDSDQVGLMWTTLFDQRTVDASALANDVRPLLGNDGTLSDVPAALALPAEEVDACKTMLQRWIAWLDAAVYEGAAVADPVHTSWQNDRMEYAFAMKAGDVQLSADEYTDGHLDWDDFEAGPLEGDPAAGVQQIVQTFAVATRHPSPVRYPGMPAERYWEFEDGNVNYAGAEAGITDFLRMSVTEFALTFGNDWFVVPIRLPVGWLYQVATFAITDSFGLVTTPRPIVDDDGAQWTMYSMTSDPRLQGRLAHTMLLADSLDGVQEGAVLEETHLARDEMANLAWAIEKKVQGVSGEPLDRDLEARSLAFQQRIAFDQQPDTPQLVYRLATPVPANWIPLLPIRQGLDFNAPLTIELIRAGMKRFYPELDAIGTGVVDATYTTFLQTLDDQPNFITPLEIGDGLRSYTFYPRGYMLRDDPTVPMADTDKRVIAEEEVPRIGATLRRKFQYARSSDGKTWLWIGRSKTAGRGEADSKLRYDVAVNQSTLR